jgi:hypothetical protein
LNGIASNRPLTVGELRDALDKFDVDTPVMMNWWDDRDECCSRNFADTVATFTVGDEVALELREINLDRRLDAETPETENGASSPVAVTAAPPPSRIDGYEARRKDVLSAVLTLLVELDCIRKESEQDSVTVVSRISVEQDGDWFEATIEDDSYGPIKLGV